VRAPRPQLDSIHRLQAGSYMIDLPRPQIRLALTCSAVFPERSVSERWLSGLKRWFAKPVYG
jgi:hypothetical protein